MRSLAAFASLLALGLLAGGAIMLAARPADMVLAHSAGSSAVFDFRSMLIGLLLGVTFSNLSRVPWLDLPRRAATWVVDNERNLYRAALAVMFVGVLMFY